MLLPWRVGLACEPKYFCAREFRGYESFRQGTMMLPKLAVVPAVSILPLPPESRLARFVGLRVRESWSETRTIAAVLAEA